MEKANVCLKGIDLRNIFRDFFMVKEKVDNFFYITFYISRESGVKIFIK